MFVDLGVVLLIVVVVSVACVAEYVFCISAVIIFLVISTSSVFETGDFVASPL